ncbi:MAG: alcohol dehydrogenase catalytic domain-containing protein [Albidovulum sp.]|nr:alcohol dehydrogenase catalytic domain-containing protein [Albidovulum sp.]
MKAVYFPRKGQVVFDCIPDPEPGPGEVLIRVRASGLCHTDIEVMRGNYGSSAFPVVPGHEFAGQIVGIGPEVAGLKPGDGVVVDPNFECGSCRACCRGWAHLCDSLGAYGVTVNGGFAEMCNVRADAVHPIGDMDFSLAALAEPMGCVLNGLSPLKGRAIERAAIFGAGPMGLLLALALKAKGVGEVIMVEVDATRLQFAGKFDLSTLPAGLDTEKKLYQACDLAVDATGVPAVAGSLVDFVANGGSALFFGVCPSSARISISPFEVFRRQLSLFGTHSLNHNIPDALDSLRAIGSAAEQVVTHQLPLDSLSSVISGHAPPGCMKVQATV